MPVKPTLDHNQLQEDLAEYLRVRYQHKPVVLTEVAVSGSYGDEGRLDVAAVWSTNQYRTHRLFGYEVKANRADLLADLRAEKWRRYLPQVDRLFFALGPGVGTPEEIPAEAGVLVRTEGGAWPQWRQVRSARPQTRATDPSLAWRFLFKLDRRLRPAFRDAQTTVRYLRRQNQSLLARINELEEANGLPLTYNPYPRRSPADAMIEDLRPDSDRAAP